MSESAVGAIVTNARQNARGAKKGAVFAATVRVVGDRRAIGERQSAEAFARLRRPHIDGQREERDDDCAGGG